jgi:hypothetical protein
MSAAPTRVLVFQPALGQAGGLDFRLLGLQFWLAERFTGIGLEGASVLMRSTERGEPELVATGAPEDPDIGAALAANAAPYGLVTSFILRGGEPRLAVARMVGLRGDASVHTLVRWSMEADAERLAGGALRLFTEACARLGYVLDPVTWEQVFDTDDPAIVGSYFTALGAVSVVEQGFAFAQHDAEISLRATLSGVRVGMRPAIELLPRLVEALRARQRAPIEMLRAAVEAGFEMLDEVPPGWVELRRAVGGAWLN